MANVVEADRIEEQVLDLVRKTEEASVDAGRKFAKAIGDFLPIEMPAIHELIKGVFDFTEGILKTQREFAQKMLQETEGMVDRASPSAPVQHRSQGAHRAQSKTA